MTLIQKNPYSDASLILHLNALNLSTKHQVCRRETVPVTPTGDNNGCHTLKSKQQHINHDYYTVLSHHWVS